MLSCNLPLERSTVLTVLTDPVLTNRMKGKPADQRRRIAGGRAERQSGTSRLAVQRETPDRCSSPRHANDGGSCSGSPPSPFAGARRSQPGPPEQKSRARTEPRAPHQRREHFRHAAERTPSVLAAARSGRQPFPAAASTGIDDRPSASCLHPVPKSVPPSPALHIRLVRALHKFLQRPGCRLLRLPNERLSSPDVTSTLRPVRPSRQPFGEAATPDSTATTSTTIATSSTQASDLRKLPASPVHGQTRTATVLTPDEGGVNFFGRGKRVASYPQLVHICGYCM